MLFLVPVAVNELKNSFIGNTSENVRDQYLSVSNFSMVKGYFKMFAIRTFDLK